MASKAKARKKKRYSLSQILLGIIVVCCLVVAGVAFSSQGADAVYAGDGTGDNSAPAAGDPIKEKQAKPGAAIKAPTGSPKVGAWKDKLQFANAALIIDVGRNEMDINDPRAWRLAVATAMVESKLYNLASNAVPSSKKVKGSSGKPVYEHIAAGDADSVGLFQQRTSQGWGPVDKLMDKRYAARKFYQKLLTIKGWNKMNFSAAAQKVQRSAYPDRYGKRESDATKMVDYILKHQP